MLQLENLFSFDTTHGATQSTGMNEQPECKWNVCQFYAIVRTYNQTSIEYISLKFYMRRLTFSVEQGG